jgi:hypothetical protein
MPGYNTEIKRLAAVFHVQTQDVGPGSRFVESLIYKSGKLISSRRTDYTSALANPGLRDRVQQLMEEQHRAILNEISEGRFDHHLTPAERNPMPDKG